MDDAMDDILYDGADVEFQMGSVDGIPILVLFDAGPVWSASALSAEYDDLRFRVASMVGQELRFVLFQKDRMLYPILTTTPEQDLIEFALDTEKGKPWLLAIQFKIDGQKKSILWLTQSPEGTKNRTVSVREPYFDRWIFEEK